MKRILLVTTGGTIGQIHDEHGVTHSTDASFNGVANMNSNEPGVLARELGAIPARDMSMESMVVKLSWLIANGQNYLQIQKLMQTNLRGEVML